MSKKSIPATITFGTQEANIQESEVLTGSVIRRRSWVSNGGIPHKPQKERITQPSMTIPDQSMTITEMLSRTARGLPINSGQVPVYNGDKVLLPVWQSLDLIDRAKVVAAAEQAVAAKKAKRDEQQARMELQIAKSKKEAEEAAENALKEKIEKLSAK